jgi:hypothetical protein
MRLSTCLRLREVPITTLKLPKISFLLAAACLISLGVTGVMNRNVLATQLESWHVLPRPERFTELYFTDHKTLAKSSQAAAFTVHNLEHQSVTYRYILTIMSTDMHEEQRLGEGTLTLDHDKTKTLQKLITIPAVKDRIAVKVTLEYKGTKFGDKTPRMQTQSIHYWLKDRG